METDDDGKHNVFKSGLEKAGDFKNGLILG